MNAVEPRPHGLLRRRTRVAALVATMSALSALMSCAAAGSLDAVVEQSEFTIRDPSPGGRWVRDDLVVMMSEEDGVSLRVATLRIPGPRITDLRTSPTADVGLTLGEGGDAGLEVAYGPLSVFERSDGARILSTSHTEFRHALSGAVVLRWQGEHLLGEFRADLEGDGYAEGNFIVALPR